jgi:hypothetical protein
LLTSTVAIFLALKTMAQEGTVMFQALPNLGGLVRYSTDGFVFFKFPTGSPASLPSYGNLNVTAYSAPDGTVLGLKNGIPDFSNWKIAVSAPDQVVFPGSGLMEPYVMTFDPSVPISNLNEEMEIVGWTGTSTTFDQAVQVSEEGLALVGWCGSPASGGALGWSQPTPPPTYPPLLLEMGPSAYNGLALVPVPEPGTRALIGLAAAFLLLAGRRISREVVPAASR